jgi:hypothetical protein
LAQVPPSGAQQTPGVPQAPQAWPEGHGLQSGVRLPQPSPCCPHVAAGKSAHVFGVQVDVGCPGTHWARSQIMYSRIFSCAVIVVPQYAVDWLGKAATVHVPRLQVPPLPQRPAVPQSEFCVQVALSLLQVPLGQSLFCWHWSAPVAEFVTWKSLKMACPHWLVEPTGVSKV